MNFQFLMIRVQWTPNYYNSTQYYAQLPAPNRSHQLGKHTKIQQTSMVSPLRSYGVTPPYANTSSVAFLPPNHSEDESKNPFFTGSTSGPELSGQRNKNQMEFSDMNNYRPIPKPRLSSLKQQNSNNEHKMELMNQNTNDSIPSQNDKSFNFAFMFAGNSEQDENETRRLTLNSQNRKGTQI